MAIRVDRRELPCTPDPEGLERVRQGARALIETELALARDLLRVWSKNAYVTEGCVTVEEFGRRCNLSSRHTRMLLHLGHGVRIQPELETALREGKVTIEKAAHVGKLALRLGQQDPDTDWIALARKTELPDFVKLVERRIAEVDQQDEHLSELTFFLADETKKKFDRARVVASRRRRQALSREQTLDEALDEYLELRDPLRGGRGLGVRRVPAGGSSPTSRYVPVSIARALRALYRDRCCVPGCKNKIFIDLAHIAPKREGGDQEGDNQLPLCHAHHVLFDAGWLTFEGLTDDGRAVFKTAQGRVLHPDRAVAEGGGPDPPAAPP